MVREKLSLFSRPASRTHQPLDNLPYARGERYIPYEE